MRVTNMLSPRTNREVANQFIIYADDGSVYFQSYKSIIAKKDIDGKVFLDSFYWNYSRTTSKYRNEFLRETTKDTEKKIEQGVYNLTDLNEA